MQVSGKNWDLYLGDSIDIVSQLPKDSIHYSIFSPPFASLYTYSASERDMGNSKTGDEFIEHFRFLVKELFRVLGNGRLVSFHCMNLPSSLSKDGYIGIKDFRGELIKLFQEEGFIYHSEVVIWKCPVVAMTRTHALGLLHNQMVKDSAMSRQGIPDYLVTMRKPGKNENPVSGGFQYYIGSDSPELKHSDKKVNELIKQELGYEINWTNDQEKDSIQIWQKYASPIWMDINPSDTLQYQSAKDNDDEKHITPLQLEVIERALQLWTNKDEFVLDPFNGIGSTGYVCQRTGRKYIGVELKQSYFDCAVTNLKNAEKKFKGKSMFDLLANVS
jgi:DNA modification methylase